MKKEEFVNEVEKLISLSETEAALVLMQEFLCCRDAKMYKECLVLSSRFYKIKRDRLMLNVSDDEYSSKIIPAMLHIISRVKYKNFEMRPVAIPDSRNPYSDFKEWINKKFKVTFGKSKQEVNSEILLEYQLASRRQRLLGHVLEFVLFYGTSILIVVIFDGNIDEFIRASNKSVFTIEGSIIGALLAGIFGAIFYPIFSGNIGHRLAGLKLIEIKTGEECRSRSMGFKREFVKAMFYILIIPNLWLLIDRRNQNLYDKIVGTVAVRKEKGMEFKRAW